MQLFLLLLLSQFPYATMQTKCSLKMAIEGLKEFNFQKPGDYLITGITSKIISQFYPYVFSKPPTYRLRSCPKSHSRMAHDFHATAMLLTVIIINEKKNIFIEGKVWIATTLSKSSIRMLSNKLDLQRKHVLFSFFTQTNTRQYYNFNSYSSSEKEFVKEVFQCSYSKPLWSKKVWERCTEKESRLLPPLEVLDRMIVEDGSGISRAIHAVASVLSAASSSQLSKRRMLVGDHQSSPIVQSWQLHQFMRNFQLHNISNDGIYLDENGVPAVDFDIIHLRIFPQKSYPAVKVGSVERETASEVKVSINQSAIQWPTSFNKDDVEMRYKEMEIWIENYGGDGVETCMAYKQGRTVLMTENELTFSLEPKER
ncbi:Vomeronasal type-2 receptor 26, partial [Ophiophagus hannah]